MTEESTGPGPVSLNVTIQPEHAGWRLDRALASLVTTLSRSRLQALIKAGAVQLNDRTIGDAGHRVKPDETFTISVPEPEPAEPQGEAIALTIVHEDAEIIIVDKPPGLVVHPAAGHATGTLVNALIAHCGDSLSGIGGVRRPGIVHRLDKDTSGLLVVAKTDTAHQSLAAQFQSHGADGRLERRYRAIVWGVPPRKRGRIDARLGRSRTNRTRIAVVRESEGRHAVTHYEVVETFNDSDGKPVASLVELVLETGRTHQIRVHMAHAGHPVIGDPLYASGFRTSAARLSPDAQAAVGKLGRQALHAAYLKIEHPSTGRTVQFDSSLPQDIVTILNTLRATGAPLAKVKKRRPGATESRGPMR